MQGALNKLAASSERTLSLGLLVVRVWFGVLLALGHGLGKVSDIPGFVKKVEKLGFFLPDVFAPAAALSEFAGGLLLALGLLTRPAAAAIVVTMLVAALYVHAGDPFAKKEFALAYGMAALAVLVAGPGRFSADAVIAARGGKERRS